MSYLLEREMQYRVTRYHDEAALQRAVPRRKYRQRLATVLRRLADIIEEQTSGNRAAAEQGTVVLQGRHQ